MSWSALSLMTASAHCCRSLLPTGFFNTANWACWSGFLVPSNRYTTLSFLNLIFLSQLPKDSGPVLSWNNRREAEYHRHAQIKYYFAAANQKRFFVASGSILQDKKTKEP